MSCYFMPCNLIRQLHVLHFHVRISMQRPRTRTRTTAYQIPMTRTVQINYYTYGNVGIIIAIRLIAYRYVPNVHVCMQQVTLLNES